MKVIGIGKTEREKKPKMRKLGLKLFDEQLDF